MSEFLENAHKSIGVIGWAENFMTRRLWPELHRFAEEASGLWGG